MDNLQLNIRKPILGEELPEYIEVYTSGLRGELGAYYVGQYTDYVMAKAKGTLEEGTFDEVVVHMATISDSIDRLQWLEMRIDEEVRYEQRELLYYIVENVQTILKDVQFPMIGDFVGGYILGTKGFFQIKVTLHKSKDGSKPYISYTVKPA